MNMWKDFADEMTRRIRHHFRILLILSGVLVLLVAISSIANAETVDLTFGECTDILTANSSVITVCAPAFPVINDTVNLTYGASYTNSPYLLTVNAPALNNCTILNVTNTTYVTNITIINNTVVMNQSCQMLNTTINLTFSQTYHDDVRNLTVKAPDMNTCPGLNSYEVTVGYDTTQTWNYVQSIIVHGPSQNCTNANVSISRPLGYGEYFKVNQPGCFVELFGPPVISTTCPEIPACPACPENKCPTCPVCPSNTVTKEVTVDTCPRPTPSINCTQSIQIEGKMYCRDSLDAWDAYLVNQSIFSMQQAYQECQAKNSALTATIEWIKSNSELVNTILIIILLMVVSVVAKTFYEKLNRGSGPVAERKPEKLVQMVKSEDIPEKLLPEKEKPPIVKLKPIKASKKR